MSRVIRHLLEQVFLYISVKQFGTFPNRYFVRIANKYSGHVRSDIPSYYEHAHTNATAQITQNTNTALFDYFGSCSKQHVGQLFSINLNIWEIKTFEALGKDRGGIDPEDPSNNSELSNTRINFLDSG